MNWLIVVFMVIGLSLKCIVGCMLLEWKKVLWIVVVCWKVCSMLGLMLSFCVVLGC